MILYINTTKNSSQVIELKIIDKQKVLFKKEIKAQYKQAEKLLPGIKKLLDNNKIKLSDIKKIQVENKGGSFTALRIGVATANALGYALNISVIDNKGKIAKNKKISIIKPIYSKEPNITTPVD